MSAAGAPAIDHVSVEDASSAAGRFPPGVLSAPSRWPNLKIMRAYAHAYDLRARTDTWLASSPLEHAAELADDNLSWALRLKVHQPPPMLEWSLIVGDLIHNLRSALDALVWELSSVRPGESGATQVQFPVESDPALWDKTAARRLRGVPAEYVERIRELQPMNVPEEERERIPLAVLNQLDIDDKHRAGLVAKVSAHRANLSAAVKFQSEQAAARNSPLQCLEHKTELVDGAVLMEGTTVDPIESVNGDFRLSLVLSIETPLGQQPLYETLQDLTAETTAMVQYVAGAKGAG